jgi:hypothetical protein
MSARSTVSYQTVQRCRTVVDQVREPVVYAPQPVYTPQPVYAPPVVYQQPVVYPRTVVVARPVVEQRVYYAGEPEYRRCHPHWKHHHHHDDDD